MKRTFAAVVAIACVSTFAAAQPRAQGGRRGLADEPAVTPSEIQRMFDAYALVQAQEQLMLADDQYTQFLPRFKALQEVRRRSQMERNRIIQELRRLSGEARTDEGAIKERIKALQDLDARTPADARKAIDAIDQVLDVRQQARFRAFEELMERRKIDLVTRARQNNRLKAAPR